MTIGGAGVIGVVGAGIGGTAIAQTFGPLKRVVAPPHAEEVMKLEVRAEERGGALVLQQPAATPPASQ